MKNFIKKSSKMLVLLCCMLIGLTSSSQAVKKPKLTILNVDSKGFNLDAQQMGNLVRLEMEKLDKYDVTDRYDIAYLIEKNNLNVTNCYGKICLVEIGEKVGSEYMLTGSVESYPNNIILSLRLINVKEQSIEKTFVQEYLNLPLEV